MTTNAAIDTAIIFTGQMKAIAEFYQHGFELPTPNESPGHLGFPVGGVYLGFDRVEDPENFQHGAVTLWFRVDDVQATFDRFVALGAKVRYPPVQKPWGDILAAIYDLDGNIVGLSQRKAE
ncbi:MAG TPA: VOC family protein [Anaerolineales bacterium]|nr:VOC family protein [Anaerolineales bacterium]